MTTEPLNCPRCNIDLGEGATQYGTIEVDMNCAWQHITCECGCGWNEEYTFTGITFDDPEDLNPLRITFDIKAHSQDKGLYVTVNEKGKWIRDFSSIPSYQNLFKELKTVLRSLKLAHELTNPDKPFVFRIIDVGGHLKSFDDDPVGEDLTSQFINI